MRATHLGVLPSFPEDPCVFGNPSPLVMVRLRGVTPVAGVGLVDAHADLLRLLRHLWRSVALSRLLFCWAALVVQGKPGFELFLAVLVVSIWRAQRNTHPLLGFFA